MVVQQIIFWILASTLLLSALMVVVLRNPVQNVLFLVLTFFAAAGMWLLLNAEFLAIILLLVYVGAVMTLFLFVVMMLSVKAVASRKGFVRHLLPAVLIVVLLTAVMVIVMSPARFGLNVWPMPEAISGSNVHRLGMVLYTDYVFDFEIAAVLLLTAIIAAITLAHRGPVRRKVQDISQQVNRKRADAIRIVKMPAEKKQSYELGGKEP